MNTRRRSFSPVMINPSEDNLADKKKIKVYKYIPKRETVKTVIKNDSYSYEKKFLKLTDAKNFTNLLKKLDKVCNATKKTERITFKSKFSNSRINSASSKRIYTKKERDSSF